MNQKFLEEAKRCEEAWAKREMEYFRKNLMTPMSNDPKILAILRGFPPSHTINPTTRIPYSPRWNHWLDRRRQRDYGMIK